MWSYLTRISSVRIPCRCTLRSVPTVPISSLPQSLPARKSTANSITNLQSISVSLRLNPFATCTRINYDEIYPLQKSLGRAVCRLVGLHKQSRFEVSPNANRPARSTPSMLRIWGSENAFCHNTASKSIVRKSR